MEAPMDPLLSPLPTDSPSSPEEKRAPTHLWLVGKEPAQDEASSRRATSAPNRPPIDRAIVEKAAAGDESAFTAIVRWYHPRFVRFAQHMLRSETEADDVVQEAFIRVYRALPYYRERERFESWLFRILANCCRTALSRNRRLSLRLVGLDSPDARKVYDRSDTRDDAAWRALLDAALDTLPVEQREAFLLHHVDGHSYESMSEITGVRQSALKMRVKRACDRLRAMLGEVSHA
jgi:RNA polymerase sigma-70 factor (ECF subfamily)